MKFYKLLELLQYIKEQGESMHGMVYADPNGELKLSFMGQPALHVHNLLLKKGFVTQPDGSYNYRP